jgi:hypothetical protein
VSLLTAINVIASTAVLHNICEDQGIPVDLEDDWVDDDDDELDRNENLDRSEEDEDGEEESSEDTT